MNIQEKAEQYANQRLGAWRDIIHSGYSISECTNGEVSAQDYTAGYNEAKRWIPIEDLLPCDVLDIVFNSTANIYFTEPVLAKNENGDIVLTKMFRYHSHIKFQWIATGKIIEWREI